MMLGKRKRDTAVVRRQSKTTDTEVTQIPSNVNPDDVFRKYFESTFDPITVPADSTPSLLEHESDEETEEDIQDLLEEEEDDDDDDDDNNNNDESINSEWSGFSDSTDKPPTVEVIDHAHQPTNQQDDPLIKAHKKSFMSTAPPRQRPQAPRPPPTLDTKEDATNLLHDLDLQRLLRESHLLEKSKTSSNPGKHRHLATDMRLQTLGSKSSIYKQEKMPVAHLVGIRRKAVVGEERRRREARENGVVLEKKGREDGGGGGKGVVKRRERGVDVPVLGRFQGGTLKLSRDDIFSIQGGGSGRGGSSRGGSRGGGRGGKKKARR